MRTPRSPWHVVGKAPEGFERSFAQADSADPGPFGRIRMEGGGGQPEPAGIHHRRNEAGNKAKGQTIKARNFLRAAACQKSPTGGSGTVVPGGSVPAPAIHSPERIAHLGGFPVLLAARQPEGL